MMIASQMDAGWRLYPTNQVDSPQRKVFDVLFARQTIFTAATSRSHLREIITPTAVRSCHSTDEALKFAEVARPRRAQPGLHRLDKARQDPRDRVIAA